MNKKRGRGGEGRGGGGRIKQEDANDVITGRIFQLQ